VLLSSTAVPGTSLIPVAAIASEAPMQQRRKARNARGLNAPDREDVFFFI